LYLKSQALFGQGDTALAVTAPHGLRARIQSQLEQAIASDPDFAQPYALLALLYAASRMYDPVSTSEWTRFIDELDRRVRSNASRAISLNRELGLPYFALALNDQFGWRWASARDNYRRATELQPNDALLITWTATLEWLSGNLGAAVERARRAVDLDPGNAWPTHILGLILHVAGEHEESVAVYEIISATHPESPLAYLHRTLPEIALGHEAKALEGLKLADRLISAQAAPAIRIHLAYLYGRLGKHAEAARIIAGVRSSLGDRFVDPIMWVLASLATGEQAQALELLDAALALREQRQEVFGRAYVKDNVWGDPVLERPEFAARRRRLREIDASDQAR